MSERLTTDIGWMEPGKPDVEVVIIDLSEENFGDEIAVIYESRSEHFRRKEHYELDQLYIKETASE